MYAIWFINAIRFKRMDKPDKEYYSISYITYSNIEINKVVVEASDVENNKFCLKIFPEGVKAGRIKECSEFYRSQVYKLASMRCLSLIAIIVTGITFTIRIKKR